MVQYSSLAALVSVVLWLIAASNYLLFHVIAEVACVGVAASMFSVAWNTRRFSSNGYLTFLGIAFLPIAVVDLLHTLSYRGMGVLPAEGADQATQLWIAGRALEACALLLSPLFFHRRVRPWAALVAWTGIASLLLVSIFTGAFPTSYAESGPRPGLTAFKIITEYLICGLLALALAAISVNRRRFSRGTLTLMVVAIVTKIASELAFTQYVSVYGDFNKLGHILKVLSSWLIFKAIVEGALRDPYQVLFHDLKDQEQSVRASELRYRSLVEVSPDALLVNRDGRIELVNPAAVQLFGASSPDQILGKSPFELFHAEYHPKLRERLAILMRGRPVPLIEGKLVRLDGAVRDVEIVAAPFDDSMGRAIQVVLRDITERKRVREELARNARRLEEAGRVKDEFLATLSHELRTPLNAILGWSEMLLQGRLEPAQAAKALEVINRSAKAQTALISDVLDVSRIISGKLRLNMRHVDVNDILDAALDTVRPAAEARNIQIVEESAEPVIANADPDRLQQIFWNLLSNAVKFTPEGGRVDVGLRCADGKVEVAVRDNGIGLEPDVLENIFQRFWQADRSTTRQYGGLGLGLAIVRHLVELHGGGVTAQSEGKGKGTTFTVTIPARSSAGATPTGTMEDQGGRAPSAAHAQHVSLHGVTVVVVDDDEDAREVAGAALRRFGAEVVAAPTAAEGIRLVAERRPDLVVADIGMPGEDGYAFIRRLREQEPALGGATPAVALTAYGRLDDRARALAAGYAEHVVKPVPPDVLAATVARVLSSAAGPALQGRPPNLS